MHLQLYICILTGLYSILGANLKLQSQTVTDYDGNVYNTVTIGNQTWMSENLRVTHYSDGKKIEDGKDFGYYAEDIVYCLGKVDSTKYYFYYNDNSSYAEQYGCLYNWYAAVNGTKGNEYNTVNIQGVCPAGWHIPTKSEYEQLVNHVGDNSFEKLLDGGETGFNALYGGFRSDEQKLFFGLETSGSYLTASSVENNECYISLFEFHSSEEKVIFRGHTKTCGYSVRCIQNIQSASIINQFKKFKPYIYPNPCSDFLYVNSKDDLLIKIEIYSLDNKLIKTIQPSGNNKLSISGIDKGVYIIMIIFDNVTISEKLIIK